MRTSRAAAAPPIPPGDPDHRVPQPALAFALLLDAVAQPAEVAVDAFPVERVVVLSVIPLTFLAHRVSPFVL